MPIAAKMPRWATGAISATTKDSIPAAVVSPVMTIGNPEWPKA